MSEPTPEDWMMIGNDIREVLNVYAKFFNLPEIPLMILPTRCPTNEELKSYEDIVPGSSRLLRDLAEAQMFHRQEMERKGAYNGK